MFNLCKDCSAWVLLPDVELSADGVATGRCCLHPPSIVVLDRIAGSARPNMRGDDFCFQSPGSKDETH